MELSFIQPEPIIFCWAYKKAEGPILEVKAFHSKISSSLRFSAFPRVFFHLQPRVHAEQLWTATPPPTSHGYSDEQKAKGWYRFFLIILFSFHKTQSILPILMLLSLILFNRIQFVADGVFFAELNEVLTRELAEDGYSGVEVRVTPMRTEIIIRATRTQNVLGKRFFFS